MLRAITSGANVACQYVSDYMPSQDQLVRNVSKIAVPTIMLVIASNVNGADAGPILYAACLAGCNAAVAAGTLTPIGIVLCFNACLPLLAAPSP